MDRSTVVLVNESYEQMMFGAHRPDNDKLGFFNVGYWKGVENSIELAQINLIETLVSFFTKRDGNGNVLDVACGKGASTKFLTKYFDPGHITGINISETQLRICKSVAPECNFRLMDATNLEFNDASFDNILCIEAAFHFMTRNRFLEEAYRVLRPGGRLAMSDIVVHDDRFLDLLLPSFSEGSWPVENFLPSLDAYRANLQKLGFNHVRIEDSTELSLNALLKFRTRRAEREVDAKKDYTRLENLMNAQCGDNPWHRGSTWCMVYAIK